MPHWPPLPQEIFVINDDITVEKPIEDYYGELDKRLQGLKSQLGSDADWMPSTYEKYMTGQHQVAGSLQRNVREYYNDFKLLRADTQVGARAGGGSSRTLLAERRWVVLGGATLLAWHLHRGDCTRRVT